MTDDRDKQRREFDRITAEIAALTPFPEIPDDASEADIGDAAVRIVKEVLSGRRGTDVDPLGSDRSR